MNCDKINVSICLTDLDKSKLKKAENGKTYLNMEIYSRKEIDRFGNDLSMAYSKTKEEREAKTPTVYIGGNAKTFTFENKPQSESTENKSDSEPSDLPWV